MPSCQGRHPERMLAGRDSTGLELARMQRNRDTLTGILEKFRMDPSLKDSEIGYMIVDCTDSLPQVIAQYEPTRTMIPASTLKLFVTGAALEIFGQTVFREVMTINQLSINWRSSKLLRKIGGEIYGESNNKNGFRAIMDFWTRKGLDLTGINFDDGNGLSRNNAVSPRHLVELLNIMRNSAYYNVFYSSLPVAGYTGTMRKALLGTSAAGLVHAKTGTIAGVKSWAGYVSTHNGRNLIFAIIVNNYTCRQKVVKKKVEEVMVRMTQV
jgi:D-alanyl-D-alanine carboxypeptidase